MLRNYRNQSLPIPYERFAILLLQKNSVFPIFVSMNFSRNFVAGFKKKIWNKLTKKFGNFWGISKRFLVSYVETLNRFWIFSKIFQVNYNINFNRFWVIYMKILSKLYRRESKISKKLKFLWNCWWISNKICGNGFKKFLGNFGDFSIELTKILNQILMKFNPKKKNFQNLYKTKLLKKKKSKICSFCQIL